MHLEQRASWRPHGLDQHDRCSWERMACSGRGEWAGFVEMRKVEGVHRAVAATELHVVCLVVTCARRHRPYHAQQAPL